MNYYYSLNNKPLGPIPLEELHQLYRSGTVSLDTLVVAEGGTEWKAYSTLNPPPREPVTSSPATPPIVPQAAAPVLPLPAASPPPPTQPPVGAVPAASMPSPTPHPMAQAAPTPGYKNLVLISWILLGGTALLSIIPIVGCLTWVMFIPVFITTVILGFLVLSRGGQRDGIMILIASIIVLPAFTLIAPIATTALLGAFTDSGKKGKHESTSDESTANASPSSSRIGGATTDAAAAQQAEQLFATLDKTQSGYLSGTEMTPYKVYDANSDGRISKDEFIAGRLRRNATLAGTTTSATAAPTTAPAAKSALAVPDAAAAKQMVNNTMLNFKNAVNSGDFEAFYRTQLSDRWKKETSPAQLRTIFATFVDKKIDLSPIFFVDPVIDPAPQIDSDGLLSIKGQYPVAREKVNVSFELSYSRAAKWGLSAINVKLRPMAAQ